MALNVPSLYPSAMFDVDSIYPKIGTSYANDTNGRLVDESNQHLYKTSPILKNKCFNPKDILLQHIPIKEELKINEVNRVGNGCTVDTLTSVDIQESV